MKKYKLVRGRASHGLMAAGCFFLALVARAAGPFTVNSTSDTHAVTPASSANDSTGHISLRSAIEAANAQAGATTINVPAGAYNLTLGELDLAPNGGKTNIIAGAGAATTIVSQTDPTNRVFNIDFNSLGRTITTLSGLTIQGGHDGADLLGGAGILAGSITSTPKDVLSLSNCIIQNNHCTTNTTQQPGGGIQMAGGDLNITACTFANNSSGQSFGGGIFTLAQSVISSLNVTNSMFVNNSMTNNSGAGPDGGGAIMIETPAGSVHNIIGCTFTNNRVFGLSGNTYGGGIQLNGGALSISTSLFISNSVSGAGGLGGAIYADSGAVNMTFCRLVDNSASLDGGGLYNHASNGAATTATNNWWGCPGGPGAGGCDVVAGDGSAGALVYSPWLTLTNTASPASIGTGQSTLLTASVLKNSSNQSLTPSQVSLLIGLPLIWNSGAHGFLGAVQTTVQANGQATALFTNDNTCNFGVPTVTLDNGAAMAVVIVQCPDLTLTKADNVGGAITVGNNWTWTIHVANGGLSPATFSTGSQIVLDNLPNSGLSYGAPALANLSGVSGTLVPAVDVGQNLTVTASGTVTLNAGASFDVQLAALPAVTGSFVNPRSGGVCTVDPNHLINEYSEGNNSATDTVVVTCSTITGTVSGTTNICSGGMASIAVAITGGTPPYSVTLNNGGGTQVGSSPLLFNISPAATTTYQVSSGSDSIGCAVTGSGSATVTITPLAGPPVGASPLTVLANSAGNQASVPPVYSSYSWSITNGMIVGPANQATVSYVAGATNNVSLGVTVANNSGCIASSSVVVPVITGFSAHTNVTFADALITTTMGIAFDGTNYWSCCGGSSGGYRLARYGLNGAILGTNAPGLDFRSVFARPDGILLARAFNTNIIYQQTSPGVFINSGIALTGGSLNAQSSVILNGAGTEFDALSAGVVSRWNTNGAYLGSVNLLGFGAVPNENLGPQNRGLGAFGAFWLSYNGANVLSIWDTNGNRICQLSLPGAGTGFDSTYGFSFCNGKVFIVDAAGGIWRAFDLYSAPAAAVLSAESQDPWNADVAAKIMSVGSVSKVDIISCITNTPSLAQLRSYQAVMLYSDNSFFDSTAMGNVVADYLDQGGGATIQTFAIDSSAGLGILGRATNGYLPFTTASYSYPNNLTLVKDLPAHPLLDGVNSFNGGSTSFQNSSISLASGAVLAAHWSNGQPLVGGKDDGAGRFAGLNFFPPSSDAYSVCWVSSTDGARLMADALLWSGKIPPRLLASPKDQIVPLGATATFSVAAVGTAPLAFQWRLNGTNLPGAIGSMLSVPAQAGYFGAYSVVVSNLYGATTSLNGLLNPPLKFLQPVVSGGAFSLFLVDADGSSVNSNRAARVNLYASTNLALPFSIWSLLTNPVVPSGSQLRADGFNLTNGPRRFFRAVEAP